MLALMLSYTFVTEDVIAGVQGRYFLPCLPLLLLAIRGRSIVSNVNGAPIIAMTMGGLGLVYLAQIYFVAIGGAL